MNFVDLGDVELVSTEQAGGAMVPPAGEGWHFASAYPCAAGLVVLWGRPRKPTIRDTERRWLAQLCAVLAPLVSAEQKPGGAGPGATREALSRLRDALDADPQLAELVRSHAAAER